MGACSGFRRRPERRESLVAEECAAALGGSEHDWLQLYEVWGTAFGDRLAVIARRRMALRVRLLGGTQVGYARVTRRWWQQVTGVMRSESLLNRPLYFVSSNSHSIANLVTGVAQLNEDRLVRFLDEEGPAELREQLRRFREGTAEGSWNNLLFYAARLYFRAAAEGERTSLRSRHSRSPMTITSQYSPFDRR